MKRKILILEENSSVPFDPRVWREAHSLQENGYEVTVLCPRRQGCSRLYEMIEGIRIYRHPLPQERNTKIGYLWEYAWALIWEFCYSWWIYIRHGFHVIQGCNPPDNIFLIALPFKLLGVKYVFDHHDANPELYLSKYGNKGILYKILLRLEKLTYRVCDVVMTTNASYKNLALTRGGVAPEDVFIVRNGPDHSTFKAVTPNPELKHGKPYLIGYVGSMGFQDGLDILIRVAEHIKNLGRRDIHFTCVGSGSELENLQRMVRERDLADVINLTGRVSDQELLEILSTADVCVNPDRPCEMNDISTMNKIMEYMALAKPIVQFDSKEGRYSAKEASLYADKTNQVVDFSNKILWLLDRPNERMRMGELGRRRVEKELAWKYSVQHLLAAYERAFDKMGTSTKVVHAKIGLEEHRGAPAGIRLLEYFRCPEEFADLGVNGTISNEAGFFQFGSGITCYGRCSGGPPIRNVTTHLPIRSDFVKFERGRLDLPFDFTEVVDNLRLEHYVANSSQSMEKITNNRITRQIYYFLRPCLPISIRRHIQRIQFRGWKAIPFPNWPVDFTIESLMEEVMGLILRTHNIERIPFIWFWPEGAPACSIMTHDVESKTGRDFCDELMNLDDFFGIKSAFQVIPEMRYELTNDFLDSFRRRGFEINVHDLSHDGSLFDRHDKFLHRVKEINRYGREFHAKGFRSGTMWRNQDWYDAFEFSYDMSVPNVARLEPQRGGCCTIMPYFVGKILELPLTTIQDYSLFYILGQYSTDMWKQQTDLILEKHGLVSFITHPDYLREKQAQAVYLDLLSHLARLRAENKIWISLPAEVHNWWRNRQQMRLVQNGSHWRIEGPESEKARIAYATLKSNRVVFSLDYEPKSAATFLENTVMGLKARAT